LRRGRRSAQKKKRGHKETSHAPILARARPEMKRR
jgi:hypothetical protein